MLRSVVSQQLLPTTDGRQVPAFEILKANNAIRTLIRDGKVHQIPSTIATAREEGMLSMDSSIMELYQSGKITCVDTLTQNRFDIHINLKWE